MSARPISALSCTALLIVTGAYSSEPEESARGHSGIRGVLGDTVANYVLVAYEFQDP